jgi:hypothetical protein
MPARSLAADDSISGCVVTKEDENTEFSEVLIAS